MKWQVITMYEPPVELVMTQWQAELEDGIFRAIQKFDVNVDKEELEKALRYDREQYEKGYDDAIEEFAEKLKERYAKYEAYETLYAHYIWNDIDNLVNELTYQPTKIEHNSLCETETYESR